MKESILYLALLLAISTTAQEVKEKYEKAADTLSIYQSETIYEVVNFQNDFSKSKPKNIILLIGDGIGVSQISAGLTANRGNLFLQNFEHIGFCKTQSANNYITDSAASGTALATGEQTNNGAVGVDIHNKPIKNIRERVAKLGMATGVLSTSSITDATPASFLAHQPSRRMHEEIAKDILATNVDVFIGSGYKYFIERKDSINLLNEFEKKGYQVVTNISEIAYIKSGKIAGILKKTGKWPDRKSMLKIATNKSIDILSQNKDGFFLMVEGAMIDWAGHNNNTKWLVQEMLDFDQTIGTALSFASKNKETLIIVTADHETGGFSPIGGNTTTGMVKGTFSTGGHTGTMVPIFAFGPGAENFTGIMNNTEVSQKIMSLLAF